MTTDTTTTQDRILSYLAEAGQPQPTQTVMAALTSPDLNPDSVKKALYRMQTAGLVVGFRLFGGYQTYWTPVPKPGDGKCVHPVTYRTEQGQQCAICGRTVTVRTRP